MIKKWPKKNEPLHGSGGFKFKYEQKNIIHYFYNNSFNDNCSKDYH